jgi:hypothetical protein
LTQVVTDNDAQRVDPLIKITEILNTSARKPRFTPTMIAAAILPALLLGMLLGPWGIIPWLFGTFFLIWWIVTLIHELGHLAIAWIAGFRIDMFAVGPVAVVRNGRSFRVIRISSWELSGLVHAIPNDPVNQKAWLASCAAAGSIANFATGGLAWYAYVTFPDSSWFALWEWTFIMFSLIAGLVSIIPYRVRDVASDGYGITRLVGMGSKSDQFRATQQLATSFQQDMLPRDWDPVVLTTALGHDDEPSTSTWALYMAYLHHLDAGRDVEAAHYLERSIANLASVSLFFAAGFFAEAAYFFVHHGADPALARTILKRIDGENVDDLTRLRAEASVLIAEGRSDISAPAIPQ